MSVVEMAHMALQVHLGDFIYEDGKGGERAHSPSHEIFTLYDYRTRYAQYRADPDFALAAQNFAWITTWDDHGRCLTSVFAASGVDSFAERTYNRRSADMFVTDRGFE